MTSFTVLVAPPGPADSVRDVLTDLSALGLTDRFAWWDGRDRVLSVVDRGRASDQAVEMAVSAGAPTRVRVCVVVPFLGASRPLDMDTERNAVDIVTRSVGPGVQVDGVRVVIARTGTTAPTADLGRDGWHTVVLTPEDGPGPDRGSTTLPGDDPLDAARSAAPAIASLVGMWVGVDEAPLDGQPIPPQGAVRLGRAYYRRLRTSEVGAAVRTSLTDFSKGLPRPMVNGVRAEYIEDSHLDHFTGAKSQEFWTRHAGVLHSSRTSIPPTTIKPVGFMAALRMFFGYLWTSLKGAPGRWYQAVVTKASSALAGTVHRVVFGSGDVDVAVVVNGRTRDGRPAGWANRTATAGRLDQQLQGSVTGEPYQRPDLSVVWQDFVAGGLTLGDGVRRVEAMPPGMIGTSPVVIRHPAQLAPGPEYAFTDIPGQLQARTGISRVEPADVLTQYDLDNQLSELGSDPALRYEAASTRERLAAWAAPFDQTYTRKVGLVMGNRLVELIAEIETLTGKLDSAGREEEVGGREAGRRKKRARLLRWLMIGLLVLVIAAVVVLVIVAAPVVAASVGVGLLLLGLLALAVSFYRSHRAFWAELHRRQVAASEAEINAKNLRAALQDFVRVSEAYQQYREWSGVLGRFIAKPFGATTGTVETLPTLSDTMPRAARVAKVVPISAAIDDCAAVIASQAFTSGWLTRPWNLVLEQGWLRFRPPGDQRFPEAMFAGRALEDSDPLIQWRTSLDRDGIAATAGDELWSVATRELPRAWPTQMARLLSQVVDIAGRAQPTDAVTFLSGIDAPPSNGGVLDATLLQPQARVDGRHHVAPDGNWHRSAPVGLDRTAVVVQLSPAFEPWNLQLAVATADVGGQTYQIPAYPTGPEPVGPADQGPPAPPTATGEWYQMPQSPQF